MSARVPNDLVIPDKDCSYNTYAFLLSEVQGRTNAAMAGSHGAATEVTDAGINTVLNNIGCILFISRGKLMPHGSRHTPG